MKRCICWWVFWVLVTSEVTRHLRGISGNLDITRTQEPNYWHHPRSPWIYSSLAGFWIVPGLPLGPDCPDHGFTELDGGRILLQPAKGPYSSYRALGP